jgi:hypothetical protein
LAAGIDPLEMVDVSAENLFKFGNIAGCSHTAAERADCAPEVDIEAGQLVKRF